MGVAMIATGIEVVGPPPVEVAVMGRYAAIHSKLEKHATGLGALAAFVVGAAEAWTTPSLNVAHVYVLIVVFVASSSGRSAALLSAFLCGLISVTADHVLAEPSLSLRVHENAAIPLWNGASRVLVYGIAALVVSGLRDVLRARDGRRGRTQSPSLSTQPATTLLPMCAWCRRIKDGDADAWVVLEAYLARRTDVRVSHGICPGCSEQHFG